MEKFNFDGLLQFIKEQETVAATKYGYNFNPEQCGTIVENSHTNILMRILQYKNRYGYVLLEDFISLADFDICIADREVMFRTEYQGEVNSQGRIDGLIWQKDNFAIINDPDGYTNVRAAADGKAEIVAKIVDGERFFFDEVPGSNWVKVYRTADADAECIGYMHSSRVMPVGGGIAAMTDDDEEVDLEIEKMIDRFASFVSQLEKVETIDEVYLKRLEKEYKDINKSAEGISFHNLPPTQQKRVRELRNKMEKEVERIKKLRYGF